MGAVPSEPVSGLARMPISLFGGKIQGNSAISLRSGRSPRGKRAAASAFWSRFPCIAEQGNLTAEQGLRTARAGMPMGPLGMVRAARAVRLRGVVVRVRIGDAAAHAEAGARVSRASHRNPLAGPPTSLGKRNDAVHRGTAVLGGTGMKNQPRFRGIGRHTFSV